MGLKKEKLLLERMKKQFGDYVPDNVTAEDMKREKTKEKHMKSSQSSEYNKTKQDFFMSKETRFKVKKH